MNIGSAVIRAKCNLTSLLYYTVGGGMDMRGWREGGGKGEWEMMDLSSLGGGVSLSLSLLPC